MKYILIFCLFAITAASAEVPNSDDYRYHTHFTKYSCRSFRDEAQAPTVMTGKGLIPQYMSVDHEMKNAVISVVSTQSPTCKYIVHYNIDAKNDILNYVESEMIGENCELQKEELDLLFKDGFKYVQKYYYYFALKFKANFENSCTASTGNFMAEFELGKQ
jgi:hypothetical protein